MRDIQGGEAYDMESTEKILWHPGFYGGIELELREWKADLSFETEHELSKEALLMDMLIIKKKRNVRIDNLFGRLFRTYNVIEYKSPEESLTIDGFFKCMGYACLYKGLGETVNQIPAEELTASLFCSRHPRKVFERLKRLGAEILDKGGGLYYVERVFPFPVQVVVTREMDADGKNSLHLLTHKVDEQELRTFIRNARKLKEPGDIQNASAVLNVCMSANSKVFLKVGREEDMTRDEIFYGLLGDKIQSLREEYRAEGRAEGRAETTLDFITNMLRNRLPLSVITNCCEVPAERIQEIANSIGVAVVQ